MLFIEEIKQKDIQLCFDLDSSTISLWSKKQWCDEFKKQGIKVYGLYYSNLLIGLCSFQIVLDEGQINYFSIQQEFRRKGFGSLLMNFLIKECEKLKIKKLLLELSDSNLTAEKFYSRFGFFTVGIRKSYYKDGSNAFLKEKKIIN